MKPDPTPEPGDDEIRAKLEQMRDELRSIAATGAQSAAVVELDQTRVGRLSRMDALQSQALARASGQRRDHLLRQITAALGRLDDGDYGYCRDCAEAIDRRRLGVDPTALLCIACAQRAERR